MPIPTGPSHRSAPANRRRSQRLFIQVRVIVGGQLGGKVPFEEETHTLVVSAHGALVQMKALLEQGQKVGLQNIRTEENQEAIVVLTSPGEAGKFNVAMEFTSPNPDLWHVTFPPEDWSFHHPDAKTNR